MVNQASLFLCLPSQTFYFLSDDKKIDKVLRAIFFVRSCANNFGLLKWTRVSKRKKPTVTQNVWETMSSFKTVLFELTQIISKPTKYVAVKVSESIDWGTRGSAWTLVISAFYELVL